MALSWAKSGLISGFRNLRNERRQNLPGWFVAAMKDALIILFGVIVPLAVGLYLIFNFVGLIAPDLLPQHQSW
jgi:hypothetical protein